MNLINSSNDFKESLDLLYALIHRETRTSETLLLAKSVEEKLLSFTRDDVEVGYEEGKIFPNKLGFIIALCIELKKDELAEKINFFADTFLEKSQDKFYMSHFYNCAYIGVSELLPGKRGPGLLFLLERTSFLEFDAGYDNQCYDFIVSGSNNRKDPETIKILQDHMPPGFEMCD